MHPRILFAFTAACLHCLLIFKSSAYLNPFLLLLCLTKCIIIHLETLNCILHILTSFPAMSNRFPCYKYPLSIKTFISSAKRQPLPSNPSIIISVRKTANRRGTMAEPYSTLPVTGLCSDIAPLSIRH
uniref:Uncharacterized protein n=1 Tax=Micrurus surinamensis TaxID=129470 RepID=A0A2D4P2A6_MICSU